MEKTTFKQNSRPTNGTGETVRVANGQEPAIVIPIVVKVVEVELPLGVILVEIRNVPIAVNHSRRNSPNALCITVH